MSHCIISFEISEYLPTDFNFTNFSFTFRSDVRDFEEDITVSIITNNTHNSSKTKT